MAKTRSKQPSSTAPAERTPTSQKYTLPEESTYPPRVLILPRSAAPQARIVTLPHPRYSKPTRYLVCPETGIYEFTKIAAPRSTPRSWLIQTLPQAGDSEQGEVQPEEIQIGKDGDLFLATKMDPVFLILPALIDRATNKSSDSRRLFLSSDDYFDKLPEELSHLQEILRWDHTRRLLEDRMEAVCDIVEAGDETMFRLNEQKLFQVVLSKARTLSDGCLPTSMEEKFVQKVLEAPVLIQKRDLSQAQGSASTSSGVSTPQTELSTDSQSSAFSIDSIAVSFTSQASTVATSIPEESIAEADVVSSTRASADVIALQRLRVAFEFICSRYVARSTETRLQELLRDQASSSIDFSPLDEYLTQLGKLRAEAAAARSMGDYCGKHSRDEEEDDVRAEKKRKTEEEKKRKAQESRGVRDLKKVNTAGMKKLSEFFKKK